MIPDAALSCMVALYQTIEVEGQKKTKEGMGFLVDDEHILTCAHVVSTSSPPDDHMYTRPTQPVSIVFLLKGGYVESTASVTEWFAPENAPCPEVSDIAVLTLDKAKPERATPAHLAGHEQRGDHFMAYGRFRGDHVPAYGTILDRKLSGCFLVKHEKDEDYDIFIQGGYSGTPVWDEEAEGFVGMVVSAVEDKLVASVIAVDVLTNSWPYLSSPEARRLAEQGTTLFNARHFEEALANFDKAIEIDPDNQLAWLNKGLTLAMLDRREEALTCYDKVLEIDPSNTAVWLHKGDSLLELIHYYGERSTELDNDYDAAVYYGSLKLYDDAIAFYDKVLKIDPNNRNAKKGKEICELRIRERNQIPGYRRLVFRQ